MRKLVDIRNSWDDRACDLIREENDVLCYHMKYRDKSGHAKDVVITISDMLYPAWVHMTEKERLQTINMIQSWS